MNFTNKAYANHRLVQIQYKGCFFHSLLELKFVLLIEDKCSWIREPMAIHYNHDTLKVTNYLTENTKKYIPDFLVRKWEENTGHLIEVKPQSLIETEKVKNSRIIAEDYINNIIADWTFTIVTEKDIILSDDKQKKLEHLISNNKYFKSKLDLIKKDKRYNNKPQQYFRSIPTLNSNEITPEDYKRYVKYGFLPTSEGEENVFYEESIEYLPIPEKEKHLKLLNVKFHIGCSNAIFNKEELELLEKYGSWLEALYLRKINPITKKQEHFLEEIESDSMPENKLSRTWYKYIKRLGIEEKLKDRINAQYIIDEQTFYRREDYYKLHKDRIRKI